MKPEPTTRRGRAVRAVRGKAADAMKDVKVTGGQLRGEKRDAETARRQHRDAHRGPVTGRVPGTYSRRPPPGAQDRPLPPKHHNDPDGRSKQQRDYHDNLRETVRGASDRPARTLADMAATILDKDYKEAERKSGKLWHWGDPDHPMDKASQDKRAAEVDRQMAREQAQKQAQAERRRGGDKWWSRTAAVDRAIAAERGHPQDVGPRERGPRVADVTAQPPPSPARDNWQARMDRANTGRTRMEQGEEFSARVRPIGPDGQPGKWIEGVRRSGPSGPDRGRMVDDASPGAADRHQARMDRANARTKGGAAVSGGDGEIGSMRDDWPALMAREQTTGDDYVASVRARVAAVEAAPVHPSVKDAARERLAQIEQAVSQAADLDALTRAADETLWDTHVDSPRPGHDSWGR